MVRGQDGSPGPGSAPPDTIYRGLSGAELGALMGMLSAATADTTRP
ncbi:MAG: hypothetical protein AB7S39_23990 [Gemmatimonadales bacterium]